MSPLKRGQRINELTSLGCSRRGLGREFDVAATSIRRDLEIAGLPESDRKAIDAGASAKRTLALKTTAGRQRRRQQRVDEHRKTGTLSDGVATTILEFCRTGNELRKHPIIGRDFPILLNRIAMHIRLFEASGHNTVRVSRKLELLSSFRKMRPRAPKGTLGVVHQAVWLAEILWVIGPEVPIWESALIKARKRAGELLPKRTPIESFEDECFVSEAKSKERSNLSRKVNLVS